MRGVLDHEGAEEHEAAKREDREAGAAPLPG